MGIAAAARGVLRAALTLYSGRGGLVRTGFDLSVDALNRLPRPMLAIGCLGFFAYAALQPAGFRDWMGALQAVPEPMWWLVSGVMGLHFGAREAHYLRARSPTGVAPGPDEGA